MIFAQIGLDVDFLSVLTSNDLPGDMPSEGSFSTFLSHATWQAAPTLTLWYIDTIGASAGIRGIAFWETISGGTRYGIGAADSRAFDTVAHEIAHILTDGLAIHMPGSDEAHSTDPLNLLASGSIRSLPASLEDVNGNPDAGVDQLSQAQGTAILGNQFIQDDGIPEPGTWVMMMSGIALVAVRVRRMAA